MKEKDSPITGDWIRTLFNRIAVRYDFLNDLLSLRIHRLWKNKAVSLFGDLEDLKILDAATGTGDLAIRLAAKGARVEAVDFSPAMLKIAREKSKRLSSITYSLANVLELPFPNRAFDGVIAAFGVRNFEDPSRGIQEMWRTLKPGGRLIILEFGGWANLKGLGPLIAGLIGFFTSDREAYGHLVGSSQIFPYDYFFVQKFLAPLREPPDLEICKLFFGLAYIYVMDKKII